VRLTPNADQPHLSRPRYNVDARTIRQIENQIRPAVLAGIQFATTMILRAGLFFIPLYRLDLQAWHDPFQRSSCDSEIGCCFPRQTEAALVEIQTKRAERILDTFNSEFENEIEYLVTSANVQVEAAHTHNIVPGISAARSRTSARTRGAGLLAGGSAGGIRVSKIPGFESSKLRCRC